MKPHAHDPRRLDVERFAAERGELEGDWPLGALPRLLASCHEAFRPGAQDQVHWSVRGEQRRRAGLGADAWLHFVLAAHVDLTCQRCLSAVRVPLGVDRWFRFVADEAQAAALDAESDDDVLASSRSFDLRELAEDELLLALPLVPRHEVCPEPLSAPAEAGDVHSETQAAESPFAALAALKRRPH